MADSRAPALEVPIQQCGGGPGTSLPARSQGGSKAQCPATALRTSTLATKFQRLSNYEEQVEAAVRLWVKPSNLPLVRVAHRLLAPMSGNKPGNTGACRWPPACTGLWRLCQLTYRQEGAACRKVEALRWEPGGRRFQLPAQLQTCPTPSLPPSLGDLGPAPAPHLPVLLLPSPLKGEISCHFLQEAHWLWLELFLELCLSHTHTVKSNLLKILCGRYSIVNSSRIVNSSSLEIRHVPAQLLRSPWQHHPVLCF